MRMVLRTLFLWVLRTKPMATCHDHHDCVTCPHCAYACCQQRWEQVFCKLFFFFSKFLDFCTHLKMFRFFEFYFHFLRRNPPLRLTHLPRTPPFPRPPPPDTPPRDPLSGTPAQDLPPPDRPKFRSFFPSPAPMFALYLSGGLLVEFWWSF